MIHLISWVVPNDGGNADKGVKFYGRVTTEHVDAHVHLQQVQ